MESIAAAQTVNILDENSRPMIRIPLDMKDSRGALNSVIKCVKDHLPPPPPPPPKSPTPPPPKPESKTAIIIGTGFFVAPHQVLTNNHVVEHCTGPIHVRYPNRPSSEAAVLGGDQMNDLALLGTEMAHQAIASFGTIPRVGDQIAVFGFPYLGNYLPAEGNFTQGYITSRSGYGNDVRYLQISAPVQHGNSGGPLLDMSGSVVGVIVARLEDASQLVNYAIQGDLVVSFLRVKGIPPFAPSAFDTAGPGRTLSPADVADVARKFTVLIYCEGNEDSKQK
jgi:S1-C subfamily serine protease